jgi:hypothetical protein
VFLDADLVLLVRAHDEVVPLDQVDRGEPDHVVDGDPQTSPEFVEENPT